MQMMNWLRLANIRAKITFLSLLGILGMIVVASINIYTDAIRNRQSQLLEKSQDVIRGILKETSVEGKYIIRNHADLVSEYEISHAELENAIMKLNNLATDSMIKKLVNDIIHLENDRFSTFKLIQNNIKAINEGKESLNNIIRHIREGLYKIVEMLTSEELEAMLYTGKTFDSLKADLRSELKDFINGWDETLINIYELMLFSDIARYNGKKDEIVKKLNNKIRNVQSVIQAVNSEEYTHLWENVHNELPQIEQMESLLFTKWVENLDLLGTLEEKSSQIEEFAIEIKSLSTTHTEKTIRMVGRVRLWLVLAGIVFITALSFLLIRSIIRPVNKAISRLRDSSEQILSVSKQLASSSRSLSESVSEQAASIEETSSSLEQISAMIKNNADSSAQTDGLMKQVNQVVVKSGNSMSKLTTSMDDISRASQDTSNIVKTIDEIAFQTNLLALNAAIEAARAGELGAGFAVVADEVRSLALRVTQAAKQSSELIESTIQKVREGANSLTGTMDDFQAAIELTSKAGEFITEIAVATNEQSQGIGQISKAITEMEKMVGYNASTAEESADSSEKMNDQADQLKEIVADLAILIEGKT